MKYSLKRTCSSFVWWVAISILPFHLHTHTHTLSLSASWPLSGWPSVIPKSQHHLPSCERSQVLKIRFSQTPSQPVQRHRLPFWAWARGSVMLFPSPDKASHRGTAFDTYEKQSWHELALRTRSTLFLFSNGSSDTEDGVSLCEALSHYSHL